MRGGGGHKNFAVVEGNKSEIQFSSSYLSALSAEQIYSMKILQLMNWSILVVLYCKNSAELCGMIERLKGKWV